MQKHILVRLFRKVYKDCDVRQGLRVRCDKDINIDVRKSCLEFCKWIRKQYCFPIRVPIYLMNKDKIRAQDGDWVYGIFLHHMINMWSRI